MYSIILMVGHTPRMFNLDNKLNCPCTRLCTATFALPQITLYVNAGEAVTLYDGFTHYFALPQVTHREMLCRVNCHLSFRDALFQSELID